MLFIEDLYPACEGNKSAAIGGFSYANLNQNACRMLPTRFSSTEKRITITSVLIVCNGMNWIDLNVILIILAFT